jgi:hypothetical protein
MSASSLSKRSNAGNRRSHNEASSSAPPSKKAHPAPKPRKPRAKKAAAVTAETLDLKLPGPGYDFATEDVFLAPNPSNQFGKKDPDLEDKVLTATKEINARKTQSRPVSQHQGFHQTAFWMSLANDHSIPSTPRHYDTCRDLLENAINYNGAGIMEKQTTGEFKNKWIQRKHYDEESARILAEQVLVYLHIPRPCRDRFH